MQPLDCISEGCLIGFHRRDAMTQVFLLAQCLGETGHRVEEFSYGADAAFPIGKPGVGEGVLPSTLPFFECGYGFVQCRFSLSRCGLKLREAFIGFDASGSGGSVVRENVVGCLHQCSQVQSLDLDPNGHQGFREKILFCCYR